MDGENRANSSENRNQMGGKRTCRRKISIRELKAEMAEICEEQRNLREGQRQVKQKFLEIETQISLMKEEGKSLGLLPLFSKK